MATVAPKKTVKKPRKPGSKEPAPRKKVVANNPSGDKPASATNGKSASVEKVATPKNEPAPNQPALPGMEDTDERVPELEEICRKVLADKEKRSSLADSIADDLETIGKLLGENNLDCYIVSGRKFYISPAESHVKITKVKQG